jgi:tRNA/tmRNA/rRNA uracil-C5-methylase (TrmA/RlmC/RlmD family)
MSASLLVTIERILPGGVGLAHTDGKTVFVSLAAAGDKVRVSVDREQGNLLFASIVEIIEPSPERIEPPCPYFGRCGGCDFQQLTYEAQLKAKADIIRDCLHRIAHVEGTTSVRLSRRRRPGITARGQRGNLIRINRRWVTTSAVHAVCVTLRSVQC